MKCIISVNIDNTIKIIYPIEKERLRLGMTEQQYLDFIISKDVDKSKPFFILETEDIPDYKMFRDAWEWDGTSIQVNRAKAIAIRSEQLEPMRTKKLEKVTKKVQEYEDDGSSDNANAEKSKRKQVRDFDLQAALSALTVEEMENYVPEIFK